MATNFQAMTKLPTGRAPTPTSFIPILVGARPVDNFSLVQLRSPTNQHVLADFNLNRRIIAGRFGKSNQQQSDSTEAMMRVVTVLNRCTKFKRFVFASSRFDEKNRIMINIQPRKNFKPAWAGKFLDRWCNRTMRSRIEPMKDVAKMLRSHRELILNWFRAKKRFNSGIVEGLKLNRLL